MRENLEKPLDPPTSQIVVVFETWDILAIGILGYLMSCHRPMRRTVNRWPKIVFIDFIGSRFFTFW